MILDHEQKDTAENKLSQENKGFIHYSGQLLRNFTAKFLDDYLSKNFWPKPEDYYRIKRKEFEENSFITISKLIEEKIKKESFNYSLLDNKLFEELAWVLPDSYYIYMFETEKTKEEIMRLFDAKTNSLNKPIFNRGKDENELQVVSMRNENDSVILLLRNGYTVNEDEKKTIFYLTCEFDFRRKTFIVKMREVLRKNSKIPTRQILNKVFIFIQKLSLEIVLLTKSEKLVKRKLYELFSLESDSAEKIIASHLPLSVDTLEKKIEKFVSDDLNLKDPTNFVSNCKTLKSLYFKNIAQNVPSKDFNNRYIFAFIFNDGTTTRSITRDKMRNHIYGKDLYWSLKSIVHKEAEVDEISIYYKINKMDYKLPPIGDNFSGLEITIRECHGSFMLDFYNRKRDSERRYKSEFIIYELEKYLRQ